MPSKTSIEYEVKYVLADEQVLWLEDHEKISTAARATAYFRVHYPGADGSQYLRARVSNGIAQKWCYKGPGSLPLPVDISCSYEIEGDEPKKDVSKVTLEDFKGTLIGDMVFADPGTEITKIEYLGTQVSLRHVIWCPEALGTVELDRVQLFTGSYWELEIERPTVRSTLESATSFEKAFYTENGPQLVRSKQNKFQRFAEAYDRGKYLI